MTWSECGTLFTPLISKEIKELYPAMEWRRIEAFRHRLVHDYYEIDLEIVWKSKENKLDQLRIDIAAILKNHSP